ncbi:MAG TPA: ATP-binding protein, partial [Spirochaetota bacterium]|nr:ATP-binding protein [Spirochaetota bacterium]
RTEKLYLQSLQKPIAPLLQRIAAASKKYLDELDFLPYTVRVLDMTPANEKKFNRYLNQICTDYDMYGFAFCDNRGKILFHNSSAGKDLLQAACYEIRNCDRNTNNSITHLPLLKLHDDYYLISCYRITAKATLLAVTAPHYFRSFQSIKKNNRHVQYFTLTVFILFTIGLLLVFYSISRTRQQRILRRAEEQRLKEIGIMAGEVAHSIKNPVQIINLLAGEVKNNQTAASLQEECRRLSIMVDSFLNLTKKTRVKPETITLSTFRQQLANTLKLYNDVDLSIKTAADSFRADKDLLKEIMENLLANSSRFKKTDRVRVNLQINCSGKKTEFIYKDNGRGINPDQLDNIFKPFFTTSPQGKGLGLATIKRNLTLMQGSIRAVTAGDG